MFSRKEATKLSGLTDAQIKAVGRYGIVNPVKFGENFNSPTFYTYQEVLELRAIKGFKDQLMHKPPHRRMIRYSEMLEAMKTLVEMGLDGSLVSKEGYMIAYDLDKKGFVLVDPRQVARVMLSGENKYQLGLLIDDMVEDVEDRAIKNKITDFEKKKNRKAFMIA